jgi:predicted nucleotidyltransferase
VLDVVMQQVVHRHDDLEKLLGRKIDLVAENSLSNSYFIQRVEECEINNM